MLSELPLFPPQASTGAQQVDTLFLFLLFSSGLIALLIAILLMLFAIRYRRGSRADRSGAQNESLHLELTWTLIPFVLAMFLFGWGASVYFKLSRPPDDTMNIMVVGKRWMWKLQHVNGRREINELHVPVGRAVKLTMTSEDVIHSFYVPAFRVKADAVPGRYTTTWFQATRTGRYHLFCTEYCGTKHSQMIGSVVVMEPDAFQAWLGGEEAGLSPAAAGERLFVNLGCITCHNPSSKGRGPSLVGVFGTRAELQTGARVVVDEQYIRESIVDPKAKILSGYKPLMPTFRGLLGEEGLMSLIEYIKSIGPAEQPSPAGADGAARQGERS
jgi:cytochrome c oxidase subunit 2